MTFEDSSFENFDPITYAAESRGRSSDEIKAELSRLASAAGASSIPHLAQLALTNDPKLAIAAIEALGRIRERAAADALLDISNKVELKEVRKRAKTMLFQLHSWGIEPSPRVEDTEAKRPPGGRSEFVDAWVSLPDTRGSRIIFTVVKEGFESKVINLLIEEDRGITEAVSGRMSRKEAEERVKAYFRRNNIGLMRVDMDYVDFLVEEALDRMQSKDISVAPEIEEAMDLWDEVVEGRERKYLESPIYSELNKEEIQQDEDMALQAKDLVSLKEVQIWFPAIPNLDDYVSRISSVFNGIIQVSRFTREELAQRVVLDAAEATFGGERRLLFARRMEELSYYLLHNGREEEAKQALAVALALRRGQDLREIPFVMEFVYHALGFVDKDKADTDELQREGKDKGSLIINPFDPRYRRQSI